MGTTASPQGGWKGRNASGKGPSSHCARDEGELEEHGEDCIGCTQGFMGLVEPDDGSGGLGGTGGTGHYVRTCKMGWPESDEELLTRWLKKGKGKAKEIEPGEEAEEEKGPEEVLEADVDMTLAE